MAKKSKKKKDALPNKNHPLVNLCDAEQLKVLYDYIKLGAAFICTGKEKSPIKVIMKGLRMEMDYPTDNGVALYDTKVLYKYNWMRPIVVVTLTAPGSLSAIHSIREVKNGRIYTKYLYKEPKRNAESKTDASAPN